MLLRPGGVRIERSLPDGGRLRFFREYELAALPERILFKVRLATPAGEWNAAWPLVPLRRDELVRSLSAAGLGEVSAFGDYTRVPFGKNSPALIFVGRRHPR